MLILCSFMLKKRRSFSSDGQTDVQLKTIVRNLTEKEKLKRSVHSGLLGYIAAVLAKAFRLQIDQRERVNVAEELGLALARHVSGQHKAARPRNVQDPLGQLRGADEAARVVLLGELGDLFGQGVVVAGR